MMNPFETFALPILALERETEIDWTFTFGYTGDAGMGRFFQVSLPGVGEAPISVSDSDGSRMLMTMRSVGRLTSKIFAFRPGDSLFFRGPYGNGFDLASLAGKDLVVVAGGTGLAPVRGLIRRCIESPGLVRSISVIAGFKSPSDILFRRELDGWATKSPVVVTVDKGDTAWHGSTGLVTEHIRKLQGLSDSCAHAIVVGPPLMMKFATLELVRAGLSEDAITVSFERAMSCGIGKCGRCKIDETYVCLEGPVFPYRHARRLID